MWRSTEPYSCVNLDFVDHKTFVVDDYANDPDNLIVELAGGDLYFVQ